MPWSLLGLTVVYVVAGKLGLMLAFVHASATAVWPPTGIALAAFLLLGPRVWPAIFLGAFLVNITTEGSAWTSIGIATGNTLEGLVGAFLVARFANGRNVFDRARDILTFVALAGLLSTAVSATIGVTSLSLGGYAEWDRFGAIWLTWWLGDVGGALVVAPLLVTWGARSGAAPSRARVLELALLLGCVVLVGLTVFGGLLSRWIGSHPFTFLTIPPLVWAAFRFRQREAATCVVVLSALATWGTLRGFGPFVGETPGESLLLLQAFMGTMAMMALPLAAVVAEHRRAEEAVREGDRLRYVASLATAAAHEINNPLMVVSGLAQMLEKEVGATQQERIVNILMAAQRIHEIIDRMTHIERIELVEEPRRELPEMLDLRRSGARGDGMETGSIC